MDLEAKISLLSTQSDTGTPENNTASTSAFIPTPYCYNMLEHPSAAQERSTLNSARASGDHSVSKLTNSLMVHLSHGLAYTVGSALGCSPPSQQECLAAFVAPNKVGLTAGARAWSKHAHRSGGSETNAVGWWGTPSGPVATINECALLLFWRTMSAVSWRNLHWLPHSVLVYEMRMPEGYGMRWSQDQNSLLDDDGKIMDEKLDQLEERMWTFRGFVEPMMENGHETGWKH
ncbi:hypothetical protein PHLCEN_2v1516 [Hermanssonia centrifuga]|uniref:Uncharacterized protein n=1 Tax=Hermanssonia centrifuga TaxID=98765 RepID=A0A2R6RZQ8_9APHY|nr:hypothetical protein PHLCEN_2v1516 [Hermanssonia centrifuga]